MAAGVVFGTHPLMLSAVVAACLVLRPILAGPLLRAVVIVYALSPLLWPSLEIYYWPLAEAGEIWTTIGTLPAFYLRFPSYLITAILFVLITLISGIPIALLSKCIFVFINLENYARQVSRDKAAERIMTRLRHPVGTPTPRFSLYLRPFDTTGRLASTSVGSDGLGHGHYGNIQGHSGNIQIDFEAIFASAFPSHRPLIALGTPGTLLSVRPEGMWSWPISPDWGLPGTGKVASTDIEWRENFMLLAHHADVIVVVPLEFPGTIWEINWLYRNGMLSKCVFFTPATMHGALSYEKSWEKITQFFASIDIEIPKYQPFGQIFMLNNNAFYQFVLCSIILYPVPSACSLYLHFY